MKKQCLIFCYSLLAISFSAKAQQEGSNEKQVFNRHLLGLSVTKLTSKVVIPSQDALYHMGDQGAIAVDYGYALFPRLRLEAGAQLYLLSARLTYVIPFVEQEITRTQYYAAIQLPIRLRYNLINAKNGSFSFFSGCMPEYHSNEFHFSVFSAGAGISMKVVDGLNVYCDAMTMWWYSQSQQTRFWNPGLRIGFNAPF